MLWLGPSSGHSTVIRLWEPRYYRTLSLCGLLFDWSLIEAVYFVYFHSYLVFLARGLYATAGLSTLSTVLSNLRSSMLSWVGRGFPVAEQEILGLEFRFHSTLLSNSTIWGARSEKGERQVTGEQWRFGRRENDNREKSLDGKRRVTEMCRAAMRRKILYKVWTLFHRGGSAKWRNWAYEGQIRRHPPDFSQCCPLHPVGQWHPLKRLQTPPFWHLQLSLQSGPYMSLLHAGNRKHKTVLHTATNRNVKTCFKNTCRITLIKKKKKLILMLYRPISQRLPNQPLAQEQPYGSGKQKRSPLQFSSEPHGCWQFRPNIPSLQAASHQKKRKTNSKMCLYKFLKFCCITPRPDLQSRSGQGN